ncbi:Holliday junction branch migration protein RuvA [Verrucomicrobiales bacterium]|jgi:Holliday junction DNA helicase RuvA|nr:Holliday junction branch migration protein RuvA [Verrucomicrobiales bacterium]MDC3353069.1 Holliday junction branch migration protein RuvA [Verrucomicrobiales bacterium]
MITFLQGTLEESWPGLLIINAGGVGYEVTIPMLGEELFGQMGEETKVLTHHHIREQEQTLYGFATDGDRDLFRLLINRVTGVGPKVAMSVLSGMATDDFKQAVVSGDIATIAKIKGLGKKTAERIVLELGDKVGVKEAWQAQSSSAPQSPEEVAKNDTLLALLALGYKQTEAQKAVDRLPADVVKSDEMLRAALRLLQG